MSNKFSKIIYQSFNNQSYGDVLDTEKKYFQVISQGHRSEKREREREREIFLFC